MSNWWNNMRDNFDQFREDAAWRNFQGGRDEIGWTRTDDVGGDWSLYGTKLNGLEVVTPDDADYYPSALGDVYMYNNDDPDLGSTNGGWWR